MAFAAKVRAHLRPRVGGFRTEGGREHERSAVRKRCGSVGVCSRPGGLGGGCRSSSHQTLGRGCVRVGESCHGSWLLIDLMCHCSCLQTGAIHVVEVQDGFVPLRSVVLPVLAAERRALINELEASIAATETLPEEFQGGLGPAREALRAAVASIVTPLTSMVAPAAPPSATAAAAASAVLGRMERCGGSSVQGMCWWAGGSFSDTAQSVATASESGMLFTSKPGIMAEQRAVGQAPDSLVVVTNDGLLVCYDMTLDDWTTLPSHAFGGPAAAVAPLSPTELLVGLQDGNVVVVNLEGRCVLQLLKPPEASPGRVEVLRCLHDAGLDLVFVGWTRGGIAALYRDAIDAAQLNYVKEFAHGGDVAWYKLPSGVLAGMHPFPVGCEPSFRPLSTVDPPVTCAAVLASDGAGVLLALSVMIVPGALTPSTTGRTGSTSRKLVCAIAHSTCVCHCTSHAPKTLRAHSQVVAVPAPRATGLHPGAVVVTVPDLASKSEAFLAVPQWGASPVWPGASIRANATPPPPEVERLALVADKARPKAVALAPPAPFSVLTHHLRTSLVSAAVVAGVDIPSKASLSVAQSAHRCALLSSLDPAQSILALPTSVGLAFLVLHPELSLSQPISTCRVGWKSPPYEDEGVPPLLTNGDASIHPELSFEQGVTLQLTSLLSNEQTSTHATSFAFRAPPKITMTRRLIVPTDKKSAQTTNEDSARMLALCNTSVVASTGSTTVQISRVIDELARCTFVEDTTDMSMPGLICFAQSWPATGETTVQSVWVSRSEDGSTSLLYGPGISFASHVPGVCAAFGDLQLLQFEPDADPAIAAASSSPTPSPPPVEEARADDDEDGLTFDDEETAVEPSTVKEEAVGQSVSPKMKEEDERSESPESLFGYSSGSGSDTDSLSEEEEEEEEEEGPGLNPVQPEVSAHEPAAMSQMLSSDAEPDAPSKTPMLPPRMYWKSFVAVLEPGRAPMKHSSKGPSAAVLAAAARSASIVIGGKDASEKAPSVTIYSLEHELLPTSPLVSGAGSVFNRTFGHCSPPPKSEGAGKGDKRDAFTPSTMVRVCEVGLPYSPLRVWGGPVLTIAMSQRAGTNPGEGGTIMMMYEWPSEDVLSAKAPKMGEGVRLKSIGSSMPCPEWLCWEPVEAARCDSGTDPAAPLRSYRRLVMGYRSNLVVYLFSRSESKGEEWVLAPLCVVPLPIIAPPTPLSPPMVPLSVQWSNRSLLLLEPHVLRWAFFPLAPAEWAAVEPVTSASVPPPPPTAHALSDIAKPIVLALIHSPSLRRGSDEAHSASLEALRCGLDQPLSSITTLAVPWAQLVRPVAHVPYAVVFNPAVSLRMSVPSSPGAEEDTIVPLVHKAAPLLSVKAILAAVKGDLKTSVECVSLLLRDSSTREAGIAASALVGSIIPSISLASLLLNYPGRHPAVHEQGKALLLRALQYRPDAPSLLTDRATAASIASVLIG
jgi:hypothetical protein